jgi:hypothetical protein
MRAGPYRLAICCVEPKLDETTLAAGFGLPFTSNSPFWLNGVLGQGSPPL